METIIMFKQIGFCLAAAAIGCGSVSPEDIDETQQAAATQPLYRSYHGPWIDHLYSTIKGDGAPSFAYDGILGYCEPGPATSGNVAAVRLHRLYSSFYTTHFYTIDEAEAQAAVNSGYYREET